MHAAKIIWYARDSLLPQLRKAGERMRAEISVVCIDDGRFIAGVRKVAEFAPTVAQTGMSGGLEVGK